MVCAPFQSARLSQRNPRLARINEQLSDFYGPLLIACVAGRAAATALTENLNRLNKRFSDHDATEEDLAEFCHWMQHVFMPLNERREKIILEKAHLIQEDHAPQVILDFTAHVASYRAILARWAKSDFSILLPRVHYPEMLKDYANHGYASLKREQAKLLGLMKGSALRRIVAY
jgi:hypothetical protein